MKHTRKQNRLPEYDYSLPGYYFVTICTKGKVCWFGKIVDGDVRLNVVGRMVDDEWKKTELVRKNVRLDEYIIMPNHVHGIIAIDDVGVSRRATPTGRYLKSNSLGSIVNQFKSICTKKIWKFGYKNFAWQRSYHDHVIRNEKSLDNIRHYICYNALTWRTDSENPKTKK